MKITCDVIRDLMPLAAEELASADSAELVREHLEGCESCRSVFEEIKKPPVVMPEEPGLNTVRQSIRRRRLLTALCAVMVVCGFGCWFLSWLTEPIYLDENIITSMEPGAQGNVMLTFDAAAVGEETFQFEVASSPAGETYTAWTSRWLRMKWNEPEPRKITVPANVVHNGIYYFTDRDGEADLLIYENPEKYVNGGKMTLPRLYLSFYFMMALIMGAVVLVLAALLRKRKAGKWLLGFGTGMWTYALCQGLVSGFTFASFFALQELKWAAVMAVCFWIAELCVWCMRKR